MEKTERNVRFGFKEAYKMSCPFVGQLIKYSAA